MKKGMLFFPLACLAAIFALSLYPQEGRGSGRVRGTVTDEEGKPLADVKILMESTSYNFKLETASDKKGRWGFMGFSKDAFKFTFAKDGFETVHAQVFLSGANRNPEQKIIMKKPAPGAVRGTVEPAAHEMIRKAAEFYEAGRYAEALSLLKEFIETHPAVYMARVNLARTYSKLNQHPESIAEYQKVLEALKADSAAAQVEIKTADIYLAMAGAYQDQGLYEEAAGSYKKAMDLSPPSDPAAPYNLAEILFRAGKVDEAICYYKIAAQILPKEGLYELKLGQAYLNKQDIPAAVEHFEKFLDLSPQDPQAESVRKIVEVLKK